MTEPDVVLFDRLSRNQLGEFETVDQALEVLRRFVQAEPSAIGHLEIWDGDTQVAVDPVTLHRLPAA
jgi:hypothetical protein